MSLLDLVDHPDFVLHPLYVEEAGDIRSKLHQLFISEGGRFEMIG